MLGRPSAMRTEQIFTNLTCNQRCTWCNSRSPTDAPAFVRGAAVRARIDQAIAAGAEELVLTGGEPAMRRDLVELVAYAARAGKSVTLETNATLIDDARARALREAGLGRARVNLAGADARLDAATRDDGGFARTCAGAAALLAAGISTELAVTLVRSTLPLIEGLPRGVVGLGRLDGIVVSVPTAAPDASELLRYEEVCEPILALDARARALGIAVRLSPDTRPPPCVFAAKAKSSQLFNMNRGAGTRLGHRHVAACAGCKIEDRCAGFDQGYLARVGEPEIHPIDDDRTRRRLSLVGGVDEQIRRELVAPGRAEKILGEPVDEAIIRVQFRCNQACRFCFVSTHLPDADPAMVRDAIVAAADRGARIMLSGGEPTLNPRLAEYVRLATTRGRHPVTIETNAVRLADRALAQELVDAGLVAAFVSLHAPRAEISDAITEAPGTFEKTCAGIDVLASLGVKLMLNFVTCGRNFRALEAHVEFVHARWPKALLNISFVAASADVVPQDRDMVPRYSDVQPHLARALARAAELGLEVSGFENMCGLPLCLVPAPVTRAFALADLPEGLDRGEFVRTAACHACAIEKKCYGLRRGYAEMWGTDELQAVPPQRAVDAGPIDP
jgi:MoaA/NifB/PqqE/SkfB family radical SAM enzyme